MNLDLLLSWLTSESSIKRVRAARGLKKFDDIKLLEIIRTQYHKEDMPWVKEALSTLLNKYEQNDHISDEKTHSSNDDNDLNTEEIEAIQSDAISDSIGQVLHEIEPVIGTLKVVARAEMDNYSESRLKEEFERLDELLQTFENWRRVEQSPRYTKLNIYELVSNQVSHEEIEGIEIEISIPNDLEFTTDQALLKIIISNAIRNAIDATLNVIKDNQKSIVISAGKSEIGLWLSVVDRGNGLPNGEKFILSGRYSTKPGHRGMGLAIVDKAVNALKGEWDIKDGKIGGAVFFIEIPRKEDL